MNLSRPLIVSIVSCMSLVLVFGFLFSTHTSVDVAGKTAQFGVPRESYTAVPETNVHAVEERKTFISSVQALLRNQPERVVLRKEEEEAPRREISNPTPAPVASVIESVSVVTPEEQPATTTLQAQGEITQPAL